MIITIVLILWRIFGNSPTDLSVMISIMMMLLFKIWSVSDNLNGFKYEVKMSFHKVKNEIKDLGMNISNLRKDVDNINRVKR